MNNISKYKVVNKITRNRVVQTKPQRISIRQRTLTKKMKLYIKLIKTGNKENYNFSKLVI